MPIEDVDNLIAVAVINESVANKLLKGKLADAIVEATRLHPEKRILPDMSDIRGLLSIKAEKLSGYAEACIRLGLASGKERLG